MKKRRSPFSKAGDASKQIIGALLDSRYQTSSLISAQIILPPESICRRQLVYYRSDSTTKNNIVLRTLSNLLKQGKVCRRIGTAGLFEYILPKKKHGWMIAAVKAAIENGNDPYKIDGIPRKTIAYYKYVISKSKK